MKPTFVIFIETIEGDIIEAFTWCRGKAEGIARAKKEAVEFGHNAIRIWAKEVKNG